MFNLLLPVHLIQLPVHRSPQLIGTEFSRIHLVYNLTIMYLSVTFDLEELYE